MKSTESHFTWDKALIIGGGPDVPKKCPQITTSTMVICADAGYNIAECWGLKPHLLIGDFDSLGVEKAEQLLLTAIPVLRFPVEKDHTDIELAIRHALGLGIRDITLTGVWGGSVGHSLGNIEVLYALGMIEVDAQILTGNGHVYLVNGNLQLKVAMDSIVSLLPLSDVVIGVNTQGLYYPLTNVDIHKGSTLTISNKVACEDINISHEDGILLVVVESKNPR